MTDVARITKLFSLNSSLKPEKEYKFIVEQYLTLKVSYFFDVRLTNGLTINQHPILAKAIAGVSTEQYH